MEKLIAIPYGHSEVMFKEQVPDDSKGYSVAQDIERVKVRFKYFRSLYYARKEEDAANGIKNMHMDRLGDRLYCWQACYMYKLNDLLRDYNNVGIASRTMTNLDKLRYISPKLGDIYDVVADAMHELNNIQDVLIHRGFRLQ